MQLRLVIFDMDDVLCHYDLGKRLRALSRLSGKTPRDIRAAIWDSGFEDAADAGRYRSSQDYLAAFGERLGYPLTRNDWIAARRAAMLPFADVLDFAAETAKTHDIIIYTNNGPLLKETLGEIFPEAGALFGDRCYCSYEFETKKPDPASYTRLLAHLGVKPEQAWFIDDKKSNVEGALIAGLRATHFVSYAQLVDEARSLGLVVPRG